MTNNKNIDVRSMKAKLLAHRKEIEEDTALSEDARQPVELVQTSVGRLSRIDALQGQAMALETDRRRHVELVHIDTALKRLIAVLEPSLIIFAGLVVAAIVISLLPPRTPDIALRDRW